MESAAPNWHRCHDNNLVLILVLVEHDSLLNLKTQFSKEVLILVLVEHDSDEEKYNYFNTPVLILVLVEHDSVLLIRGCQ